MEQNISVDSNQPQSAPVDAGQAVGITQDNATPLSEVLGTVTSSADAGSTATQGTGQAQANEGQDMKVDKGFQGRVNAEVRKQVAAARQEIEAQYAGMITPLQEMMFAQKADALVASGDFGNPETALEYLRLKYGGLTPSAAAPKSGQGGNTPARDANGQFTGNPQSQGETDPRTQMLVQQAATIQALLGIDMAQVMREDEVIGTMVSTGKWDMNRAAQEWQAKQGGRVAGGPPPVRNPNHTNTRKSFRDMTPEEFNAIRARLQNGERIDPRQ